MRKSIIYIIMCIAFLSACQDENAFGPNYKPDKMGHMMKLDRADLSFAAAGGSQTIQVRAKGPHWKFEGMPDWLTISQTSGIGDMAITFTATENTATEARTAILHFMADEQDFTHSKDISVRQEGVAIVYHTSAPATPLSFKADATDSPQTISVTSNEEWTATVTPAVATWCTVTQSATNGNGKVTVTATENESLDTRTATITIKGKTSGDETKVSVTQPGLNAEISVSPTSIEFEQKPTNSQIVTVTCNEEWKMPVSNATWCKVESKTVTGFTVTAETNQSFSSRSATITVTSNSGKTATVSVTQKGGTINYEDYDEDKELLSGQTTYTANGVSFVMVAVEGGTFQMGATNEQGSDADDGEKPVHQVTVSSFSIGQTEVTQALWYAVMGQKPTTDGNQWNSTYGLGDNRPAYYVSWNDCQEFITKLNQITGQQFRLPTEAEWEFAARGGNKSNGYKYSGSNTVGDVAWYYDNSSGKTHDVATKQANELGIYDMSGNLWEWCSDWYGSYSSSAQTNPTGPASGSARVFRGGGWSNSAGRCRVANRYGGTPADRNYNLGLRLAL